MDISKVKQPKYREGERGSEPKDKSQSTWGPRAEWLEVLDATPGRVYTGDMMIPTQDPEFEPDQITQATVVGFCFALAVLLVLLAAVEAWL